MRRDRAGQVGECRKVIEGCGKLGGTAKPVPHHPVGPGGVRRAGPDDSRDFLGDRAGARRVGLLCPQALPHCLVSGLAAQVETVDATDALDRVKAIKSAEEIALIRRTAALQDRVFAEVCDFIRPGVTDRDVAAHAEVVGRRLGSDQGIHLGLSAPLGSPSRFMNRPFQTRGIGKGDHMSLLIEVNGPGGIYLEIARTMVLGTADDHLLKAFETVAAAERHTLSLMKPGA